MIKSLLIGLIFIFGCRKDTIPDSKNQLSEGFEGVSSVDALLEQDNWVFVQHTAPSSYVKIDSIKPHSGSHCLKVFAAKGNISKSDIANNELSFLEDDIVLVSAWFYLEGTQDLNFVFLLDLEERSVIGANPGLRVAIDDTGYIVVERNKYGEPTLHQSSYSRIPFPRNKWVHVELEIALQQKKKGYIKLWQDEVMVIDEDKIRTLPVDRLYTIQGTTGMYQSMQIGVTATTSDNDVTLYVDDIDVKVQ